MHTILLFAADNVRRMRAAAALRARGHRVFERSDIEEARRLIRDRKDRDEKIDLIITDVWIGKHGGMELFFEAHHYHLRFYGRRRPIPVILFGHGKPQEAAVFAKLGFYAVILQPWPHKGVRLPSLIPELCDVVGRVPSDDRSKGGKHPHPK